MTDTDWIPPFLYYAYRPWGGMPFEGPWEADKTARRAELARLSEADLIAEGARIIKASFGCRETADHVIPLSGGLDSRAILGALLETAGPSQIRTVSFGRPGSLDFDLGRSVAQAAGVRWEGVDVRGVRWNTADLVEFAARHAQPFRLLSAYLYTQLERTLQPDSVVWSGFLGGPLGGHYCPEQPATEWTAARRHFARTERRVHSVRLAPPDFDPESVLPKLPFLGDDRLSYEDQLDIFIRQSCWIRPNLELRGYDLRLPFPHDDWAMFMLCVPHAQRYHKTLYKNVLQAAFPDLYALPIKRFRGLPIHTPASRVKLRRWAIRLRKAPRRLIPAWPWGADPMLNDVDFERAVRVRPDLRAVCDENMADLARRRILDWVDVAAIWDRHRRGLANHLDALLVLVSLELFLKAGRLTAGCAAARGQKPAPA